MTPRARALAVVPFVPGGDDPDAAALAGWLTRDAAARVAASGALLPRVVPAQQLPSAREPALLAQELGRRTLAATAALGLGGEVSILGGGEAAEVVIAIVVADASGQQRGGLDETVPLEQVPRIAQAISRAVVLALGQAEALAGAAPAAALPSAPNPAAALSSAQHQAAALSSAPAPAVAAEAVRLTCRADRTLAAYAAGAIDDPSEACGQLVRAAALAPGWEAPRQLLYAQAAHARGSIYMPAFLAALERLAELRPDDRDALLALGDYRHLHLDVEGARELYRRARDLEPPHPAPLVRLSLLAEEAGDWLAAAQDLRAATRLFDDPALYLRLGLVLLPHHLPDAIRSLSRAVVLAPQDPGLRLTLARALLSLGDYERAEAEALEAQRCGGQNLTVAAQAEAVLREVDRLSPA